MIDPKQIDELVRYSPSAHAFYMMKGRGDSAESVLDEAIVYYEKVVKDQQDVIMKYVHKFGTLEQPKPIFRCGICGFDKKAWSVTNSAWYCGQCRHYVEGQ